MKTAVDGEDPTPLSAEIVVELGKLTHERRLATLVEVAKLIGVDDFSKPQGRARLINAFRDLQGVLTEMQSEENIEMVRQAVFESNPQFTSSQVDQVVAARFGGRR